MRAVMALADGANEYVDAKQPWALKKRPEAAAELRDVCTVALNLVRQIAVYLAPTLRKLAEQAGELLSAPITRFQDASAPIVGTAVREFSHMMQRVDPKKVDAVIAGSTTAEEDAAKARSGAGAPGGDDAEPLTLEPLAPECTIDDFTKVDLRAARIVQAEAVPEADKLVKLTVSLGGEVRRTVFAGIKAHYTPESLVGRLVVVVANLKPRKMRFGVSEGMVVSAGRATRDLLLSP